MRPFRLILAVWIAAGCGATPPTAPDAEPIVGLPESPAPGSAPRITRGALMGAGRYSARGTATLTLVGGTAVLELGSEFQSSSVPDPVIYVGTTADPNFGTAYRIGRYRTSGAQRFVFSLPPAAAAGTRYVMLWCDAFNAPVGYALLQ